MNSDELKKLLDNLRHKDASIRRSVAEALAAADERAIYPLIKALRDDNNGVQDAAMRSLMSLRDESTAYMILPLLREDSFLRNTAMIILKELGRITIPLLRNLLHDKDDDVRKFALDLIHDINYCDYTNEIIDLLLNDPNANVRAAAARTLGTLCIPEAVSALQQALNDEEWVCFSALEALSRLNNTGSAGAIASLLKSKSEAVRLAAIETLGTISTTESEALLKNHFATCTNLEKKMTLKSLIRLGSADILRDNTEILFELLREGTWDDVEVSLKGFSILKDGNAVCEIIRFAGNLDPIIPDNEDKINLIKETVCSIKLSDPCITCDNDILQILKRNDFKEHSKIIAIEILGEIRCKNSVPLLIEMMRDNHLDIRRACIKSISLISGEESIAFLRQAIVDHDSHVRRHAIATLGRINDQSSFEPIKNMIISEEFEDVRDDCIIALLKIDAGRLLAQVDSFNDEIRDKIGHYASTMKAGLSC